MTVLNHTRGPWFVVDNGVYLEVRTAPGPLDGEQIGDVCASKHIDGADDNPVAVLNAHLFAAAPDLLEALRDMVSDHAALSDATLEFARAAISKATGGK